MGPPSLGLGARPGVRGGHYRSAACAGRLVSVTDYYPVVTVQPNWVLQPEAMGGKSKFWFLHPGEKERRWLFKYPRPDTGEHWAEKIASEVAQRLDVPVARVELAISQDVRGSATESFIDNDQQLFHGNQILASQVGDYDPELRYGHNHHTLQNIWLALERSFEELEGADTAKVRFASFLVLDAVIGNTDCHHENWGLVRRTTEDGSVGYLAPSFDHASSMGRELTDVRRERILASHRIGEYSERGAGGIYWSDSGRNGPSPLQLARLALREYPDLLSPVLERVAILDRAPLKEIVGRMPDGWMADSARRFLVQLIIYNCQQLQRA